MRLDDLLQGADGVAVGPLLQDRLGQRVQLTQTQQTQHINNSKGGESRFVLKVLYLYFVPYCIHIVL